jgi:hypothetical protein
MYWGSDLASDVRTLASEVFNRSWQFIEQDPVLAGEDRQALQEQLARLVLALTRNGERNLVVIANQAIGTLRQQYARQRQRPALEKAA